MMGKEIEDYINLIRPIIDRMKAEGRIDDKFEERLADIGAMKDDAWRMIGQNEPIAGEQVQKVMDALVEIRKEIE